MSPFAPPFAPFNEAASRLATVALTILGIRLLDRACDYRETGSFSVLVEPHAAGDCRDAFHAIKRARSGSGPARDRSRHPGWPSDGGRAAASPRRSRQPRSEARTAG